MSTKREKLIEKERLEIEQAFPGENLNRIRRDHHMLGFEAGLDAAAAPVLDVEKIARALWDCRIRPFDPAWEDIENGIKEEYRKDARAVVEALGTSGGEGRG